jgi:hypothetical protein
MISSHHRTKWFTGVLHLLLNVGLIVAVVFMVSARAAAQEIEEASDHTVIDKAGPPVSVRGVVLNNATGEPLAHALVSTDADTLLGALTDGQGRFEIANVPSGLTTFFVRKPGFRDPVPGGNNELAKRVRLAAQMPDLVFALRPIGTLDGQVQLSTADPAANFVIDLLHRSVRYGRIEWETVLNGRTDEQGFYHFSGLEPGIYTLHSTAHLENPSISPNIDPANARGIRRDGYACVYYPDARTLSGAGQIYVGPGEHARADIKLSLEPFYPVTFAVHAPDGQPFRPDLTSDVARRNGPMSAGILDTDNRNSGYVGHYDQATGTIQADLPDGTYTLRVFVNEQIAGKAAMGDSRAGYLRGLVPFTVAGHALRNVPLALFPPTSHLLHVHRPAETRTSREPPPGDFNGVSRVWLLPAGDNLSTEKDEMNARREGDAFDLMYNPLSPQWLHTRVEFGFCAGTLTGSGINPAREPLVTIPAQPAEAGEEEQHYDRPPELLPIIFGAPMEQPSLFSMDQTERGGTEVTGVAPGAYEVRVGEPRRRVLLNLSGSQDLSPNAGSGAATLKVTIRGVANGALPPDSRLFLFWSDKIHPRQPLHAEIEKNACEFGIVPPGTWELFIVSRMSAFPILATSFDGQTHTGNQLRVTDKPLDVELSVRTAPTLVDGFAMREGKGKDGFLVLLVPQDPTNHADLFRRDQSDSDGSFTFRSVPPGAYTAVAIENGWNVEWQRPEILARYLPGGVAVSVPDQPGLLFHLPAAVPIQTPITSVTSKPEPQKHSSN